MAKMIFVNLPVADLGRATAFYEALGFQKNPRFSNAQASSMAWSDTIVLMLLGHDFYRTFTGRPIADTRRTSAFLLCLSQESRAAVDAMLHAARAAGATEPRPAQDLGFMYGRSFEDLDGHEIEVMWMDPALAEGDGPVPGADAP